MSALADQIYRPATYSAVKTWRERHGRYRLVGVRCRGCGRTWFPRRTACAGCHGRDLEAYQPPHTGEVVVVWQQLGIVRLMAFSDLPARYIGIVRLDDGTHVEAEIVDASAEPPPGTRVAVVFRKLRRETNGNWMYGFKFTPVDRTDS